MVSAIAVQHLFTCNAKPRLKTIFLIVDTGVNDLAVPGTCFAPDHIRRLQNNNLAARLRHRARCGQPDDPRADHHAIGLFNTRVVQSRSPELVSGFGQVNVRLCGYSNAGNRR